MVPGGTLFIICIVADKSLWQELCALGQATMLTFSHFILRISMALFFTSSASSNIDTFTRFFTSARNPRHIRRAQLHHITSTCNNNSSAHTPSSPLKHKGMASGQNPWDGHQPSRSLPSTPSSGSNGTNGGDNSRASESMQIQRRFFVSSVNIPFIYNGPPPSNGSCSSSQAPAQACGSTHQETSGENKREERRYMKM